jgi:hypothetical protein
MAKFLIVEDDESQRFLYDEEVQEEGYEVVSKRIKMGAASKWPLVGCQARGKNLLCKNYGRLRFSGPGEQFQCRMAKKEATNSTFPIPNSELDVVRSARRILRKPAEASRKRAHPADAFCPESRQRQDPGPHPKAYRKCQILGVPWQTRGFT